MFKKDLSTSEKCFAFVLIERVKTMGFGETAHFQKLEVKDQSRRGKFLRCYFFLSLPELQRAQTQKSTSEYQVNNRLLHQKGPILKAKI